MDTSTLVGNSLSTDTNGAPLGWLGQLGAFAGSVAPLVTAIKGPKAATYVGNPTNADGTPVVGTVGGFPAAAGFSTKTLLLIGGGALALVLVVFLFLRKK